MSYKHLLNEGFRKGYYCSVPVYVKFDNIYDEYGEPGMEMVGINKFWNFILKIVTFLCVEVRGDEGFYVKVPLTDEEIKELKEKGEL